MKTTFTDGDISSRTSGTRVLANFLNLIFRHRHDGRDQDGSAPLDYAADSGDVNTMVVVMPMPFDALIVGLPIGIRVNHTNTDAVTVTVDGFGPHPLHKLGGLDLAAGDIHANQIVQIAWDGTNFQLLTYQSVPVTDATTLQGQGADMLGPPGIKGEFFMPTAPAGWLPADGRALLRSQYPALFAAIGTTWGAGDNVTTFNLPEVRGEFFRAWDNGRGIDADRLFGSWQQDAAGPHTHDINTGSTSGGLNTGGGPLYKPGTGTTETTELNSGAETRPRNIAVLVCIKF